MVRATPIQTSFNSGEWSPILEGHIDLEKRASSGVLVQNMIPLKQGPLARRGGTRFIKEVKTSSLDTALVPFEFSTTQAFQIEMGNLYFRFFTSNAPITESAKTITGATQADPVVISSTAHGFSNGDEILINSVVGMTELNGKFFLVANATANDFELTDVDSNNIDGTGFTAYVSGGTAERVFEIVSPFATADIIDSEGKHNFQHAQSADVLYFAQRDFNTRSLVRITDTNWVVNDMVFVDGPYLDENITTTTLGLSATSGNVTVTASSIVGINGGEGFKSTDVDRTIRFRDAAGNWTHMQIITFISTTVVNATIKGPNASATTATTEWRLGVYSDTTGFPSVITFFQDRIVLCGSRDQPDRYDLSRTSGYSDTEFQFAPTDADGTVTDDAAISGVLQSGRVNVIQWADSDEKGLLLGTSSQEWLITPSARNEVLTPSNRKSDPVSSIGGAYIKPVSAESGNIFMQRARRRLHDIIFSFEADQLKPRDITLTSEHITQTQVVNMVFQQEPINVVWAIRTDGLLIGHTYYPDQGVFAWHRHPFSAGAKIKDISVIPSADGSRNELSLIVERTINGVTRKYVEFMTRHYEEDIAKRDAIHIDSALSLDNPITISGATQADPVVITATAHGFSNGDFVDIESIIGMVELNDRRFKIKNITVNTFELTDLSDVNIDGTAFTAYVSDGKVREAVTSVSGLDHLEGQTVKAMIDGKSHPDLTVTNGSVTLANDRRASVINIGLGNVWAFKSQKIEAGSADGVAQGKTKRLTGVVVRLFNTLGLSYGPNANETDEFDFDQGASFDEDTPLFTGDTEFLRWPGGYEQEGQVFLTDDGVFPASILAIIPTLTTYDRG